MKEWLPQFRGRSKWQKDNQDLKVDDVVIIFSPDLPRGKWPLGIIVAVYPGQDDRVRVVDVKTGGQIYKRPANKMCPLIPA